jgi:FkbM family methyltransferase
VEPSLVPAAPTVPTATENQQYCFGSIAALIRRMTNDTQQPFFSFDSILALRRFVFVQANKVDFGSSFIQFCGANLVRSRSQLFQDLLVVFLLKGKRSGFFVELGAANGHHDSNTVILERDFQWKGILAEPAKCWHSVLKSNRSAVIDERFVWSQTGAMLPFKETEDPYLSTLTKFVDADFNREGRIRGKTYQVETISLNDLLKAHNCPKQIDYLSIDTEGSEIEILRGFNFEKYNVGIITVEHNFREPDRQMIFDLLIPKGFVRLFEDFSKFDDWYVKQPIIDSAMRSS